MTAPLPHLGLGKTYEKLQHILNRNILLRDTYGPATMAVMLCCKHNARTGSITQLPTNIWKMIFFEYLLPLTQATEMQVPPVVKPDLSADASS